MGVPYGRRAALQKAVLLLGATAALARARVQVTMLALGDSLTAGYGLAPSQGFVPQLEGALQERGRAVRVVNGGVSGDTMAGGLARLDWLMAEQPRAALVALGANDGLRGLPVERMRDALHAILDRLAARRVEVLLAGMQAPPNLGAEYGRAFHAVFVEAARDRNLLFMPFFLEGVAGDRAFNQGDGIHPNARGVAVMVQHVLPRAEELLDRLGAHSAG